MKRTSLALLCFLFFQASAQLAKAGKGSVQMIGYTHTAALSNFYLRNDSFTRLMFKDDREDVVDFKFSNATLTELYREMKAAATSPKYNEYFYLDSILIHLKTWKPFTERYVVFPTAYGPFNLDKREVEMLFGERRSSEKRSQFNPLDPFETKRKLRDEREK